MSSVVRNPYPLQQGLRHSEIVRALPVPVVRNPYPLQQGLRQIRMVPIAHAPHCVRNPYPLQQGLRLYSGQERYASTPSQKPISITTRIKTFYLPSYNPDYSCQKPISITTRIKTISTAGDRVYSPVSETHIHYNKD